MTVFCLVLSSISETVAIYDLDVSIVMLFIS